MEQNFPNDADGDALRRLARDGSDLSKPMYIDFQVAVPDEASANGLAQAAKKLGYQVAISESPQCRLPWTCECSTRMIATHIGVCAIQGELAELAKPFGGYPDGWGSFGNVPGK
ncbi:MAG: ribonuclease E inhibitor RraB [Phycisphaerales bacterium]